MRRDMRIIAYGWAMFLALLAASADAAVTVYTDRTQWQMALDSVVTENFEGDALGNHQTPFTTAKGTLITNLSGPVIAIQVFPAGIVNNSQQIHFRDFTAGVQFTLSAAGNAFGFDYYASDGPGAHQPNLPWLLSAGGVTTPLVADLPSFVGYIDDQASLKAFTLIGPDGPQGGISLDDLSVGTIAPQTASACIPPPNTTMVAWYPFDETTGTLSANLATGNAGMQVNSPTPIPGMVGGALRFNGVNTYVESPASLVTNFGPADVPSSCSGSYSTCQGNFSIDAWIRVDPAAASALTVILDNRSGSAPAISGYHLFLFNGALGLQLADGTGNTNYVSPLLTPSLADGNWHHIAVTVERRSSSGIRWYHNGALLGTGNPTDRLGSLRSNSPLRIGTRTADSPLTGWFRGDIDELEIYNRVLTPHEVASLFKAGTFGKCK